MASASIWKDNKVLKKWLKKYQMDFVDGNFNYDMNNQLSDPLLTTIAEKLNINKEYIYLGAGSSQLITVILNLKIWNKIFISLPEFGLYTRNIGLNNVNSEMISCLTANDFINQLRKIKSTKDDLLCISSPRWFSGERFTDKQIEDILLIFNGSLLIDEAYIAFSNKKSGLVDLALKNDRILIIRSMSKTYFASGFRIGYLITKKEISGLRNTFIAPHSISTYSARFMIKLLNDKKMLNIFNNTIEYIKSNRDLIYKTLKHNKKFMIIKSESNFISLIFKKEKDFNKCYDLLSNLPGIQKFKMNDIMFIKVWISDEKFSKIVIERISKLE